MLKRFESKKIKKLAIGTIVALFAIAVALVAILIANKSQKTKERKIAAGPELARAMTYDQFQDGDEDIDGTDYVKFGAFFLRDINGDGYAEKIKGTCKQVGKEDTLYMELNVLTNGYLENGVITINNNNFYLQTAIPKDSEIKDNVISNNTKQISLNQINNGTQKLLTAIVRSGDYSYDSQKTAAIGNDTTKMSGINSITLTGTHVADDGTRTEINKTIELNMDWYGTATTEIPKYFISSQNLNQVKNKSGIEDKENNRAVFNFNLAMTEVEDKLILTKTYLEGTVPQLNGYDPIGVETTDSSVNCTYNADTRVFTLSKSSQIDENGILTKECTDGSYSDSARGKIKYNNFKIRIMYPLEAYQAVEDDTVELRIPIKGYYEGYNNPNEEFTNPYQTNIATETLVLTYIIPTGTVGKAEVWTGKYVGDPISRRIVSKKNPIGIYNGIAEADTNDTYLVEWDACAGDYGTSSGMVLKERKEDGTQLFDEFIKSDATSVSMEDLVANVGISFVNPEKALLNDGWIKVYDDDTGDLIHEFTANDWLKYSTNSPYEYPYEIKHIRVETSGLIANQKLIIYNVKEIDDDKLTTMYTKEQFDDFKYVKSSVVGYVGENYLNKAEHSANYEVPFTYARIEINKTAISTQETEKDMQIKIKAQGDETMNQNRWKNGAFLVKMPKDIIDIDEISVTSDNENVTISSYESYEENGERFIKIITENEEPTTFTLTINCQITPDPRIPTTTEYFELYSSNEEAVDYYNPTDDIYDVNGNLNTTEKIAKESVSVSLVSPNSLLTNQVASNYDDAGSIAIAPQTALVSKERRSATVNIEINNNYANTISNVQILGRTPFENNKYAILNEDMGSTFTATMTNEGIILPEGLKDIATVYYSTNGEATVDLTNTANGWTKNPTDYTKVKSYLVDLGEYKLTKGESHTISYNINIPAGLNYNQVTYSHHGVYFCLDTAEGKYKTRTEPNKVGFMIAKQYDLELTKYHKNKTNTISKATYAIYEEGKEEKKTRVTGLDGSLSLKGLFVDRTYVIKEIKSPEDYELNEEEIKFTVSESDGKIVVTKEAGTVKNIQAIQSTDDSEYKVQIEVEDEANVRLQIQKTETGTTTPVKGIVYKLRGAGLPSNGRNITTNTYGEAFLKGLKVGEEYTIEEIRATGYYLVTDKIKFKVTNTDGTYEINVTEGTVKSVDVTEEEYLPVINMDLEDDKIPTYDLDISKIKRVISVTEGKDGTQNDDITYLQGAKFKLYKGTKEIGSYVSDANGKILITGLYQYIDGKDEEAVYTLKETFAPEGYTKVKDIKFKVDGTSGELEFINLDGKDTKYTVEGSTIKLTIEDSPSFKLIKKDAETGERLANIKFAIYNIDDETTPAQNSKGEILGTKETINGKEYYTVTTDSNGEITADLPEGMYKAIEVDAPEKYDLSQEYYFGIGASREGNTAIKAVSAQAVGGDEHDRFKKVAATSDGGYIAAGYFESSTIDLGNGITLNKTDNQTGMIVKYSANDEVEWAKEIGYAEKISALLQTRDGGYIVASPIMRKYNANGDLEWEKGISSQLESISETSDGGYLVVGSFTQATLDLGNGVTLTGSGGTEDFDLMIIKYNSNGDAEWAKGADGTSHDVIYSASETSDGGYIAAGYFGFGTIDLGNGITFDCGNRADGLVIKYNAEKEVEWAKVIAGTNNENIFSIAETTDGGYIAAGTFTSDSIDLGDGVTLNCKGSTDGMIVKYDSNGKIEWAKSIGGNEDEDTRKVLTTDDGGYIVVGFFRSESINLGENAILLNKTPYNYSADGMIIKYSANGEAEWAKSIGTGDDYEYINDIAETIDGDYVVAGEFREQVINVGNGVNVVPAGEKYDGMIIKFQKTELANAKILEASDIGGENDDYIETIANTNDGGYIVGGHFTSDDNSTCGIAKYSKNNEIEWTKTIGESNNDRITSVIQTSDGGYLAGGYFTSSSMNLENGVVLNNVKNNYKDGMLIKYSASGIIEWAKVIGGTIDDRITSVIEADDGGYIAVGYFNSSRIYLENGQGLITNGRNDGLIIKYSANGNLEWTKLIGGTKDDYIYSIAKTSNGGYIVGGYFWSEKIDLGNGQTLTQSGNPHSGLIIRYDANGNIQNTNVIEGDSNNAIYSVAETSDGGYIAGGYFNNDILDFGNGIILNSKNNAGDGMVIKYDSKGEVEWATSISGRKNEYIESIMETNDGGYIGIGYFNSQSAELENGISFINTGDKYSGVHDGIIIKYNSRGVIEWAKKIGETGEDRIQSVIQTDDGDYIVGGYFKSESIDLGNGKTLTNKGASDGMILKITGHGSVPEVEELEVNNKRKEFKVTTDVSEIDGIKGGTISGEDANPYETIKYGDTSINEIKMVPDENYEIIKITVNGQEYKYTANADGSYTMPSFTNVTENKHIEVTYSLKDNKIIINKVDKDTKEGLAGAKFKLDQIEERSEPNTDEILGDLTDNGQEYSTVNVTSEVTGKFGDLTNNGTYYFVQNEDGTYVPTNSKTYQLANGGTGGISSSTANSYIPIDLTGVSGNYAVVINASNSSERYDYGYATITTTTSAPSYSTSSGRFVYVSGNANNLDFTSSILQGGKKYYLHLGYYKDSSGDTGDDQIVINSIKLYSATSGTTTYNFIQNNGKLESSNQGKSNTIANSYIPIDLTNYTGKYNLVVNAEISACRWSYGFVTVKENTTAPQSYDTDGRFIYISSSQSAADYTTILQGGKMYYLHLGYDNDSCPGDDDKFIINSIKITLNDSEMYQTTVETNYDGQAITQIPFGKYNLTEIQAPDGYILDNTPRIIEFRSTEGAVHEFTVEDEQKAKLVVHHYIKGTTTKLANDENYEGVAGEKYTTAPKLDLDKYELEVDSNGVYVLPANAVGTYKSGVTEVIYYYVEKQIPLTVHHYIEGTTEKVPLKAGGTADDVTGSGKEGDSYTTTAISDTELSDEYELAETPLNASGTYSGNEVIVTYYYKKVTRDVNLVKYKEDGITPLEGAKFTIDGVEYITNANGKIQTKLDAGTYEVTETEAPEGYKLPENPTTNVTITKATTTKDINITNEKKTGTVTVHHYIEGTTTPVPLADGTTAKDEVKTGNVGDMYATKIVDNLSEAYELVSDPDNSSGTYIDGNIEVIYYYKTIPATVTVHHYIEGTTTKLAEDETINGLAGDKYTTSAANVDNKYELVAKPSNAEGKMTKAPIEVIYYYKLKDTSVLVHHYIEGTSESLSDDVIINGKVDSSYTTTPATDIPSKYELVATPDNATGTMTVEQTVVTYYYRLKATGVDVHYYKEGTTEKVAEDVTITGRVDQKYTTTPATNVPSKYELVATPDNASGTMTEARITVIYYYRLKDTSVLVHHYIEGTTTKLSEDVTIPGQVDDSYETTIASDIPSKYELVSTPTNATGTMTEAQIVVTYYYRLKDTSVLVHHYIKDTTTSLSADETIPGKVDSPYTTTPANDIPEQYELVQAPSNATGTMTEAQIVVTYYYQLKSYPYVVNYLEKDTNEILHKPKQGDELVYGTVINSIDEKLDIDGYNYDSADKDTLTIGIENNVINLYYTKRTDLSYKVNYLEKGTNQVIHEQKVQNGMTYDDEVISADEVIGIDGYNYDSVDKDSLKITTGENVINIYYTKRTDLSYTVNYLEKDTNKVLNPQKNVGNKTFGEVITSNDEIIDIDGYNYDSVDKNSLKITTGENVINIYYVKRSDLSYTVNYLEKDTNKVLNNPRVVNNVTFGTTITSENEKIDIDGYNYDSVDKTTLTITTGDNIINIYYTKKNDLIYKVNYLEKTTNKVLHDQKVQGGMTFEASVDAADEIIDIEGYNFNSVDKETLKIGTGENVINIYYTKKNDLSYKVNYLEKTTNKVLHDQKVVENMTFEDTVDSSKEVITIDGYNYDSVDKATLTITTGENVINVYYTKRNDLSYTVNYLEKDTNKVLNEPKIQNGMTFESVVNSADEVIQINGYKYDSVDKDTLTITTGTNVINIYYTKITGLSYTVNYLEKDTNIVINPAKTVDGVTFEDTIDSSKEIIAIDGYNYDSVDKDILTIGTGENIINIYYTKRTDLSYKVNYLEKGTNKVLHEQKVVENMTFDAEVTSSKEVIDIDGYNYDSVDKTTLKITTGENVINIYYTKRNDLSYKVNYLEKDTNKVLHDQKVQDGMTYEDTVTSSKEVIAIDGYNYDSVDKDTLVITTGENVINIYYTKRTDLSYKVNYLEKTTNKVLHDQKVVENMTFESTVRSADEVIDIDGYNYDSVDKETLTITTGENVINIYYTKRNDLSYTVNYLEKTTNKVLHDPKVVENMTFEDTVDSSKEVIAIDGYNYDSVDKDTLTIGTGDNVINVYYTKRNDLSYTVNYLEKGTNKVINAPKVTGNMTFEDEITSANEIIPINGYSYDSVDKDKLIITTGANVINIYYTKVQGLAYTVNYLEKDTDKVIHEPKTTDNMTFEDEITSADEVIEIDGYNYDSVDKDTLVIGTGANVINIYYTKRNDLSYKVNYLEKDTNKVLHDQKVVENMTFDDVITSEDEVIDIDGYDYNSVDKETLTITTSENVINIYYTKRNDLSYKVNYLEKDTNNVIHDQKVVENMIYESVVNSADEVITIYGYNYDSVDKDTLTITTGENVINIYYTKKDAKVTIHYYEEGTTNKVSNDKELNGKVNDEYTTTVADDIESKYELVEMPANATGVMTEDDITVIYYFRKKATQVIVRHYEEGTTNKLSQDVTINGRVDDAYTTTPATDIPIKYELSVTPANANGTMAETTTEVIYYYRVKDAVVNVRYLEKNTNIELAPADKLDGKVDDPYTVGAKTIDGYTMVEHSGNESGKFEVDPITITYYYLYNTKATVQYIDKITGQILEQSTQEGLEGDEFATESKDFANYILVEEPPQKTVKMTKDEIVLKYYYIHISGGVIEKHIDVISGEILANDTHNGNEGDAYNIPSRTFAGYDLVEDRLPNNAQGTMKVDPIEVIYYYIYRTKVTAEYIDKNTNTKLSPDEIQNGHEKDPYTTERKTFDDYKLVEVPANADGEMTKDDITVTYYYVHTSGGVIINHVDINTGKQLLDETKQEGYEGDPYETHEENIPGYTLVQDKYPANATGTMTIEPTRVTYYYVKNTEVNVKYIDKETGEEIAEKTNIPGNEGDNFTTEPKDVPGYDLVEEPAQKDGTMTAEPIEVIYYYRRPAKVIAKYFDNETKEEIATEEKQEGHQNDEYTTEAKDIKYYKLLETPRNANGTMTVTVTKDENGNDIVEDTTYVNYYYRKLDFNLSIDKKVASVTINGNESVINGDLAKIEVYRKDFNTAKVEVKYTIKVTNDGELSGKASILEDIPSGMTMSADKNSGWDIKGTTATRETKDLQPGESEEYVVVLDWENGANNVGMKENTASIISTENEAGYDEKDTTDNEDKADIIVAISTGGHTYVVIAGGILLILIAMGCGVYVIKKRHQ